MAKVYSAPAEIERPKLNLNDGWDKYQRDNEAYVQQIREFVKKRKPKGQLVGEVIRFPVADGYAEYMVASLRPLELIHLDVGDAWQFQYIELITAKQVREQVERERKFTRLFGKR